MKTEAGREIGSKMERDRQMRMSRGRMGGMEAGTDDMKEGRRGGA